MGQQGAKGRFGRSARVAGGRTPKESVADLARFRTLFRSVLLHASCFLACLWVEVVLSAGEVVQASVVPFRGHLRRSRLGCESAHSGENGEQREGDLDTLTKKEEVGPAVRVTPIICLLRVTLGRFKAILSRR